MLFHAKRIYFEVFSQTMWKFKVDESICAVDFLSVDIKIRAHLQKMMVTDMTVVSLDYYA